MSTRLIVLGLLQERPYHGYDLKRVMKERYMDEWANVAFGSIYFALGQMATEGWIAAQPTEREGNRPSRTVYRITESGRREFLRLLRECWQDDRSAQDSIRVCVFFIKQLPREEAIGYVRRRVERVERGLEHLETVLRTLPSEAPWEGRCIADRDRRLLAEEIKWTQGLLADIESDRVAWPDHVQSTLASAFR
jgi:DNA-binding PadR family transcriptional regulator